MTRLVERHSPRSRAQGCRTDPRTVGHVQPFAGPMGMVSVAACRQRRDRCSRPRRRDARDRDRCIARLGGSCQDTQASECRQRHDRRRVAHVTRDIRGHRRSGYDANLLENIERTKRITAVVMNGRYLSRADLDTLLHRAAAIVKRWCNVKHRTGELRFGWSVMQARFDARRHDHIPVSRQGEGRRDAADAPQQISASVSQLSLGHRSSETAADLAYACNVADCR